MAKRRAHVDQLAFGFLVGPAKAPAVAPRVDDLAARLIAAGFAPNDFILDLNRGPAVPRGLVLEAPWSLPSRLFRSPIEFMDAKRGSGPSRLLLRHPKLSAHPFVQQVEAAVEQPIAWEPEDEFGRPMGSLYEWFHSVDLMSDEHWRDLCCTSEFTTREDLLKAIAFAVSCSAGHEGAAKKRPLLALETARYLLGVLGADEPVDRSGGFLGGKGLWPGHIVERHPRTDKITSERWAVNIMDRGAAGAWAHVHGIEDGWLYRDRSGHLQVSKEGLLRRGEWKEAA